MYRILIADDEPIILAGIRHILDWKSVDAELVGSARNGAEAYAMIESEHPDIVITDIKMPVMDGLGLVEKCSAAFPDIVFIILTSLAEFSFAREAIGYGVSDYLLKTELDEDVLKSALEKAESECERRRGYREVNEKGDGDRLSSEISNLLLLRNISSDTRNLLSHSQVLSSYAFAAVAYQFPSDSLEKQWSADDYRKLQEWEADVLSKIVSSMFSSSYPVIPSSGKHTVFIYLISDIKPETWQAVVSRLDSKIKSASGMVTGLDTALLSTKVFSGSESLKDARMDIEKLLVSYYLDNPSPHPESLDVDVVFPKLELSIGSKDSVGCRFSFSQIRDAVKNTDHSLSQFEFSCSALHSAIQSGLSSLGLSESRDMQDAFEMAEFISKRSEALLFLDDAESALLNLIESAGGTGGSIADKAREYVLKHITEHISLSDVASYACVSPGYMSKSFKRVMGMSLVDYINQKKVEKSKEMMRNGEDRIADIASFLGFRNIYYFSKVFRKVEGIPPTDYIKKITGK